MGMYDEIRKGFECPKCKKQIYFNEQIKWTNKRRCHVYNIGDKIDAADGEYDWCTYVRPRLYTVCKNCNSEIDLKAIVNEGILKDIVITSCKRRDVI